MRLIDADALMAVMYHEAFETDSDRQKWDSGCWIRYKMFEEHIANAPTVGEWIPVSERLPVQHVESVDLISRQDAVKVLNDRQYDIRAFIEKEDMEYKEAHSYWCEIHGIYNSIELIESLPSADLRKMIGCTGCEHYDQQQTAMICRECRRYYKDKHSEYERREP